MSLTLTDRCIVAWEAPQGGIRQWSQESPSYVAAVTEAISLACKGGLLAACTPYLVQSLPTTSTEAATTENAAAPLEAPASSASEESLGGEVGDQLAEEGSIANGV